REPLTGTSEYPGIQELPVSGLQMASNDTSSGATNRASIEPLPSIRLAEPFEQLRDASDRAFTATGSRPRIFLANLGTPSDFTARATFAKNFFEAGGIEAITNDRFSNVQDLAAAFKASGAQVACLCSSN